MLFSCFLFRHYLPLLWALMVMSLKMCFSYPSERKVVITWKVNKMDVLMVEFVMSHFIDATFCFRQICLTLLQEVFIYWPFFFFGSTDMQLPFSSFWLLSKIWGFWYFGILLLYLIVHLVSFCKDGMCLFLYVELFYLQSFCISEYSWTQSFVRLYWS